MPRYNKQEDFEAGVTGVTPFFKSLGYRCAIAEPRVDKEGVFYLARFTCEVRSVELHHLYSLGPVFYKLGEHFIEHTAYLEALGVETEARYPSYEDDSRSGYTALLQDLKSLLPPFFNGPIEAFTVAAIAYMDRQRRDSQRELRRLEYLSSLERRMKASARDLFRMKRFDLVAEMESQIDFPDFLTESEREMFSLARKRTKNK